MKEIIFESKLAKMYDPLDDRTLALEKRLINLEISPEGRIQGIKPITSGAKNALPAHSGVKKFDTYAFIVAPEGQDAIVVVDKA